MDKPIDMRMYLFEFPFLQLAIAKKKLVAYLEISLSFGLCRNSIHWGHMEAGQGLYGEVV